MAPQNAYFRILYPNTLQVFFWGLSPIRLPAPDRTRQQSSWTRWPGWGSAFVRAQTPSLHEGPACNGFFFTAAARRLDESCTWCVTRYKQCQTRGSRVPPSVKHRVFEMRLDVWLMESRRQAYMAYDRPLNILSLVMAWRAKPTRECSLFFSGSGTLHCILPVCIQ